MSEALNSEIEVFSEFRRVVERDVYRPLPEGWWIAVTDVVDSTEAIDSGRYKAVNMAGASVISAAMNALGRQDFPFAFGGDGAQLAVPPRSVETVRNVLARTVRWSRDALGLELRAALVPLTDIRRAGQDVLVARFAPSEAVRYAMFAGGGMEWADAELKAGRYAVAAAAPGEHPDLAGLSCRWKPIGARSGVMLSLIVRKARGASDAQFFAAISEVLASCEEEAARGNPLAADGPEFGSPFAGLELEARATGENASWPKLKLLLWRVFAWLVVRTGVRTGGFDPVRYRRQTALNADFRKFQDGLHMTIDCRIEKADALEALLRKKAKEGSVRFGAFRQSSALMTCIVPSYVADNHLHFIDGAEGGYAEAARRLKAGGRIGDAID